MKEVITILDTIQQSAVIHKQNVKKLLDLLKNNCSTTNSIIKYILSGCVDQLLINEGNGQYIKKIIEFLGLFFAHLDESLLVQCLEHLYKRLLSNNKTVRLRTIEIINSTIENVCELKKEYDNLLLNQLTEKVVVPLKDKIPNVRIAALKTLKLLQVPEDSNDPATLEVIKCMRTDTSASVRVAAVMNVALCEHSKNDLCARLKDVKPEVRIAALTRLVDETDIRQFTTKMRAEILCSGLGDRDEKVRSIVLKLIWKWLSLTDNNIPKFLGYLNPVENHEAAQVVGISIMDEIIKSNGNQSDNSRLKKAVKESFVKWQLGFTSLTPGEMIWNLIRCNYARSFMPVLPATEICDAVLPDATELCVLLSEGKNLLKDGSSVKIAYITRMLLALTPLLSSSTDICGLKQIIIECEDFFTNVQLSFDRTVEFALRSYIPLHRAELANDYNSDDVISNFKSSAQQKIIAIATELRNSDIDAVNLEECDNREEALEHAKSLVIERSLQLTQWALQQEVSCLSFVNSSTDPDATFTNQLPFVLECLQKPVGQLRFLAVGCLGLLGLIDENIGHQNKGILVRVASGDFEEDYIRSQALQCIVDFALIHRSTYACDSDICNILLRMQESGEPEMMLLAAESTAKLLYAGVLCEPALFSNLLKFFFLTENVPQTTVAMALDQDGGASNQEMTPEEYEHKLFMTNCARLQQLLSIFFHVFTMPNNSVVLATSSNGDSNTTEVNNYHLDTPEESSPNRSSKDRIIVIHSPEDLIVNAVPQLVADMTTEIKDGTVDNTALSKILKHLFALCADNNVAITEDQSTLPLLDRVEAFTAAALIREVLKLSCNNKEDKALAKEYVKLLSTLSVSNWIHHFGTATIHRVFDTLVLCSPATDKVSIKHLDKLLQVCVTAVEANPDSSQALIMDFLSLAPGLTDLVELAARSSVLDQSILSDANDGVSVDTVRTSIKTPKTPKRGRSTTKKSASKRRLSDSSDEELESNDCIDEDEEETLGSVAEGSHSDLPDSPVLSPIVAAATEVRLRLSRSSKTNAARNIATQLQETITDDNKGVTRAIRQRRGKTSEVTSIETANSENCEPNEHN